MIRLLWICQGLLKPDDLDHDGQLERIVSENYRLISQEGRPSITELSHITHLVQGAVCLQTVWHVDSSF